MPSVRCVCLLALLISVVPAQASPITDTVVVGTQEWAQVDLFTSVSWNDVNEQCPSGVCGSGSALNGYELDGWSWASSTAVQGLLNSITGLSIPIDSIISEVDSAWAPFVFVTFRPTFVGVDGSFITGLTSNRHATGSGTLAFVVDSANGADSALIGNIALDTVRTSVIGAFFVRDPAAVPAPATLALVGLGFAGLGWSRRKKV